MVGNYKTPGVYIEEIPKFPPSIAQVETAIPAFIGYTEKAVDARGESLINEPKRIASLLEYERFFGGPEVEKGISVVIEEERGQVTTVYASIANRSKHLMYYSMQLFFANGGGPCWIVSTGDYSKPDIVQTELKAGLDATEKIDEITLIVFPEAQGFSTIDDFGSIYKESMDLCESLKDRFTVMDVWLDSNKPDLMDNIGPFRSKTTGTINTLKYGAAYYPNVKTILDFYYGNEATKDGNVTVVHNGGDGSFNGPLSDLKGNDNALYFRAVGAIRDLPMELPPSSGMVGIYASVDNTRGVWKAPANVSMDYVIEPVINITNRQQEGLNVDTTAGKSINVIRSFPGRGSAIVWGARTLAGNDNEWRYVSVRRFFNMVEESTKKATEQFVFEPNDANTWTRVKAMIENFLSLQWRAGALQGAVPEHAYYVKVGLGETMTSLDILEGRMNVEIGMAVVRPAEFIILKFSHKLAES